MGTAPRVWVAYSGGLDSSVLLHCAAAVRRRLPGALHAVHIDHGLHPDSGLWSAHCQGVCAALAIPLTNCPLDLKPAAGESLEALARAARYRAFADLLTPGDLLLTAHHQDDQAETLLLALLRGSGVHGLAAMPFSTELGPGRLVRPFLGLPRSALEHHARALGLGWVEDPSNGSPSLDRNYLRLRVLPLLRERWPAASATLARSAGHCAESAALIDRTADLALAGLAGQRPGTLSIPALSLLDLSLSKAVLRLWLRRGGFPLPDQARLVRILTEAIPARADRAPLVAWQGCEVRRYRSDLMALRPLPPVPSPQEIPWAGGHLDLPMGLGRLQLAHPLPSDQHLLVHIGGAGPGGPSLKKRFQDLGIPAWLRPYVPLVCDAGRLVSIAGYRISTKGESEAWPGVTWSGHPWEGLGFFP